MAQVLASRNPHYTVSADGIALFDPKLNEAAANFEKLTAFVKKIRFRFPQLKFLVHFYQKDFDEITNITVDNDDGTQTVAQRQSLWDRKWAEMTAAQATFCEEALVYILCNRVSEKIANVLYKMEKDEDADAKALFMYLRKSYGAPKDGGRSMLTKLSNMSLNACGDIDTLLNTMSTTYDMDKSASGEKLAEATLKAYLLASISHKSGRGPEELDSTYRDFQKRDASYATMADELRQLQIGDSGTEHPIVIANPETPAGQTGQGIFSATGSSDVNNKKDPNAKPDKYRNRNRSGNYRDRANDNNRDKQLVAAAVQAALTGRAKEEQAPPIDFGGSMNCMLNSYELLQTKNAVDEAIGSMSRKADYDPKYCPVVFDKPTGDAYIHPDGYNYPTQPVKDEVRENETPNTRDIYSTAPLDLGAYASGDADVGMLKGIIKIQAITRGKHMRENEVKLYHNDNDSMPDLVDASVTTASDLGSEHDLVAFNDLGHIGACDNVREDENEVKLYHNDNDSMPDLVDASVTTASDLGSEHDLVAFNDPGHTGACDNVREDEIANFDIPDTRSDYDAAMMHAQHAHVMQTTAFLGANVMSSLGTIVPIIKIQAIARKKYVLSYTAHDSRYAQEHQRPDLDTKARPQATVDKPTRPREERPKWHDEAKNDLQAWVDSHAPTCTIAAATPVQCLADGGGHRHDVHGYTRTRLKVDNVIFEVDNDNIVPGFTTKVLSVGMLRKQGFKMSLDTEPCGFYTPEEEWVAVNEHDNLLYIDAEHATEAPTAPASGGVSTASGGVMTPMLSQPGDYVTDGHVEVVELFAGRGQLSKAALRGARIVAVGEIDETALEMLRAEHPDALAMGDTARLEYRSVPWSRHAYRIVCGGFPCQMVAPQGLQLCWDDPRAAQALHFVAAVDANKPHAAIYENVYSFWALMGPEFDKLMAAIGYVPKVPGKTPRIEFFRATEHGSCLWRDRIHRHYEPANIELGNLAEIEKSKLYATPQRLEQHLLPASEVPEEAFLPGEFKRLEAPRRAKDEDPYSPLIVATITTKPGDKVTAGSRVRIRGSGDAWSVLEVRQHTVKLMRDERSNPTTVEVDKRSHRTLRGQSTYDASRLMSPRTFGQDTPNMIVERPSSWPCVARPRDRSRVSYGRHDRPGLPREQQQRHVGAIVDVMADAISARAMGRASVAAAKLAPSATMAPMMSVPAPPPLLRPRALENAPSKLPAGASATRRFLHLGMGHCGDKVQTATAKDHNWTLTGDKVSDCRCKVDNMRAAPTFAISRSAEPRDERVWNIDLMGPMQTKARSGARYVFVAVSQSVDGKPAMVFTHGLAKKSDAIKIGIPAHFAEFAARDKPPRVYVSDLGGEFESRESEEVFARLAVVHRRRAPEAHVDVAENAIKRLTAIARTSMQTGVAASLWEYAIHWAADCLNVRADPVSGTSAYEAYFGHKPDMTAICEFGASVAALDNGQRKRFDPNGVLTTYLGPARSHGCGAIYVYAQQNVRVVRTWRFLAFAGEKLDAATLRVVSEPAPADPAADPEPPDNTRGYVWPPLGDARDDEPDGPEEPEEPEEAEADTRRTTRRRTVPERFQMVPGVPDGKWSGAGPAPRASCHSSPWHS
ncbi:hypothetical protein JL721_8569 [Aureococcus anophagefferens]|nr:hypothetical protein JL721_8569 [Aureococcus anophagefferens]